VSALCESGRLLTVTLDAQGHELARAMSAAFFDADQDPVFVQGIPTTRGNVFLSFLGEVHEIDFSGAQPAFTAPWSLVSAAEKGHWRPGANQLGAIHRELGRLYVPMHEGGEGTHKDGGTEIWVYDLASHRRLARWPLKPHGLSRVTSVQVSQDPAPILFAATETSDLAVFDALTGRLRHITKHVAQSPWMLLNP
jgi:methylamine dehydrogenase heavy chain